MIFYLISDWDCVAHRLSTSRLYFNIGIDFTGFFLDYDCVAWQVGRRPRGRPSAPPTSPLLPHVDPRRLVFVFTDRDAFADFVHRRLASRYSVWSADVRDPPVSRDVHPRTARLFPEYGGLPLLRLFG